MKPSNRFLICSILLALLAIRSAEAAPYEVRQLSTPDGCTSEVRAINNLGQILGGINSATGATVALWDRTGALSTPMSSIRENAWAYDMNDSGALVGEYSGSDGYSHPYIWRPGTGMTDLFAEIPPRAHVWSIGAGGQITGHDDLNFPNNRTFAWDSTSGFRYMPMTGYVSSYPVGITDSGLVAGTVSAPDNTTRAFLWSERDGMSIPFPAGSSNSAVDVSGSGILVGFSSLGEDMDEMFIWSAELGRITMGTRDPVNQFSPCAVNDHGTVAGTLWSPGEPERVFVWNQQTGFQILGEGRAYDINNDGWVVGTVNRGYDTYAMLWEPVPEPSAIVVLGAGVAPLAGALVRRRRER